MSRLRPAWDLARSGSRRSPPSGRTFMDQRAAIVMSLVQSAKLNGHGPWAYLKDVLTWLPEHLNSRIDELLPHNWQ